MSGRRLLLVEADRGEARRLIELLGGAGQSFEVSHVESLGAALSAAGEHDVVLLDLSLPDGRGQASIEAMARASRSSAIVAITGSDDDRAVGEALAAGAHECVPRPELTRALLARALRYATERRKAEEEARLFEAAQRALRSRDEMLAVVSHDLRNPLNVVSLALGMLEQLPEPKRAATIERARRALSRMERLLADLLDVARIDAGTLHIEPRPVELSQLLDDALELHRPLAAQRGIVLERDFGEALGWVMADRDRMAQVLSNLIGNALKFTPSPGTVRLSARAGERRAEITVADSGPGIAHDSLAHVFDRFWQQERRVGGVGLGLAIAKGIVEAHGGSIEVESPPGEGARFRFALPRAGARAEAPA